VTDNRRKLAEDPHPRPGSSSGDREKLAVDGEELYRLHVGRSHTTFYTILEDPQECGWSRYCPATTPTTGTDSRDGTPNLRTALQPVTRHVQNDSRDFPWRGRCLTGENSRFVLDI
jgi:hypothetical protein